MASIALAHEPDDWSQFDHQSFQVIAVPTGDSLVIDTANGKPVTVKLAGIAGTDAARVWLSDRTLGKNVTLLLSCPQTRDAGQLRAFVFLDNENLAVELAKAGLAYADRRETTVMDGVIDPAESEARKKKRGMWASLTFEQMPPWRQAWLRGLGQHQAGR